MASSNGDNKSNKVLLDTLKNRDLDSELRIESYLSLVVSPSKTIASEINSLLQDEPVNQVGSFITSHIVSVRSSVDKSKQDLKQYLGDIKTPKNYPKDFRRYSFNHEFSYGIDSLGIGGSIDTNVIYSQKNFLPRSSTVNFTTQIFGTSFNVFELNGRQENLERIIEYYLGPKGYFNTHSSQDIHDEILDVLNDTYSHSQFRHRRSLKSDANAFAKSVYLDHGTDGDIDLDLSIKVFGSEVSFLSLGQHALISPNDIDNNFKEVFAKTFKYLATTEKIVDYNTLFLDAELAYPTSIGFPLKLIAQGTGAFHIEVKSAIDIPKIVENWQQANVNVKFVPSANVLISGELLFDASAVAFGINIASSVHSSTGIDVNVKVLDGRGFSTDVKFPTTKQEIISYDLSISFIQRDKGQPTIKTPLQFNSKR